MEVTNIVVGEADMVLLKTQEENDKLLAMLEEIKERLDRAQDDRLRLVNERVKLNRECANLREMLDSQIAEVAGMKNEREKALNERQELLSKLERANQRLKTLAMAAEVQKKTVR